MQAILKVAFFSLAVLFSFGDAAVLNGACKLCGANECPPTSTRAVELTCDKQWSLANGQCPKPIRDVYCKYSKSCIDQIPQQYSLMLYEDEGQHSLVEGFSFHKTGGIDQLKRYLVTLTVPGADGKYTEAYRYVSEPNGCDAVIDPPLRVLNITVAPVAGD